MQHIVSPVKYSSGVERRLQFIEFRLAWEGSIQRSDLMSFFGISVQQASLDLSRYLGLAPTNLKYDTHKKAYVVTPAFRPVLISAHADSYLSPLLSIGIGLRSKEETFIGWLPNLGAIPSFKRWIDPNILSEILSAIRYTRDVHIRYHSITRGEVMTRWLAPHALGFDGFRWHVRAYCHLRNAFRDFVLARIAEVISDRKSSIEGATDRVWHRFVNVTIAPHPRLSDGQKRIVQLDYGMDSNGTKTLEIRGALLFYLLRRLGIERENPTPDDNPDRNQIVLVNRSELEEVLKENEEDTP